VPSRTGEPFELALSHCDKHSQAVLEQHGWRVRDALSFSSDIDAYRGYIRQSRGEFTVAKDQNIRLRSGWFSDRSATYLAAGRPVITQETGFSEIFPTEKGLFGFSTTEEIMAAIDTVNADYVRHSCAARAVARNYFSSDSVLAQIIRDIRL
jgi:hypothetical protein